MEKYDNKYQTYVDILKEELVPAMGCTEPIAIAYCGALLKKTLGNFPDEKRLKLWNDTGYQQLIKHLEENK